VKYPHLKLSDWPFRVVPAEGFYSFIADREQLSKDVSDFLRNVSRREASSMHLMWAWLGAGKTHTLQHIAYRCRSTQGLVPVYTEFPKSVRGFLDIYKAFIAKIDLERVGDAYMEVYSNSGGDALHKELLFDFPDLVTAFRKLIGGNDHEQMVALRWFRVEVSELRVLRGIGINRPLGAAEDAVKLISWIVRLLAEASRLRSQGLLRVIWMLDEYQRIKLCRAPAQTEINGCVHALFNRCPNSLTILISFTGKPEEKKLPTWLSGEIRDRIGIEKVFLLPPLSNDEARQFVLDVLCHFRNPVGDRSEGFFPFTRDSVDHVLRVVKERAQMKPRSIMQFFNAVLEEAEPRMDASEIGAIEPPFVEAALKDRVIVDDEEEA
jgi:hypothetical protein